MPRHSASNTPPDVEPLYRINPDPSPHDLASSLWEIRGMLIQLLRKQGDERAGARYGKVLFGDEEKIQWTEAVGMLWGRTVTRDKESTEIHAGILRDFATVGIGGAVLETSILRNKWVTSREAVERFCKQTGFSVVGTRTKATPKRVKRSRKNG